MKRDVSWLTRDRKRENCPHTLAWVKITITVLLLDSLSHKHILLISLQFWADCLGCNSVGRGGNHLLQKGYSSCSEDAVIKSGLFTVWPDGDRKRQNFGSDEHFFLMLRIKVMVIMHLVLSFGHDYKFLNKGGLLWEFLKDGCLQKIL